MTVLKYIKRELTSEAQANFSEIMKGTPSIAERRGGKKPLICIDSSAI